MNFLGESRINGIYSHQSPIKTSNNNSDVLGTTSNPTSDSEPRSSSVGSSTPTSRSRSPLLIPPVNSYDTKIDHDYIIDNDKSSSLLTGTSFDVLMNSLKSMREKDLDYLIHNSDDSLIRVLD